MKPIDPFDPSTWDEDERQYFKYIEQCVRHTQDESLSNGRPSHAVYLINTFLKNAKSTFNIYSGSLRRESTIEEGLSIYSNPHILDSTLDFLMRKNSKLNVVIENSDVDGGQETHPLLVRIRGMKSAGLLKGEFTLKSANQSLISALNESNINHHLMVMDDSAYRVENDTKNAKAFMNFGDQKQARKLSSLFNKFHMVDSKVLIHLNSEESTPLAGLATS